MCSQAATAEEVKKKEEAQAAKNKPNTVTLEVQSIFHGKKEVHTLRCDQGSCCTLRNASDCAHVAQFGDFQTFVFSRAWRVCR